MRHRGPDSMRAAIIVGVAALVCHGSRGQTGTPKPSVRFVVTDCWGNSFPAATIQINSIESEATEERLSYPMESEASLRPGRYHALITAQGFFANSRLIQVSENDIEVRNC